ncbi:small nuclear ribonucleoprotein G [Acrasis kona]|uniref:Small nuclear ribonucleoprotein G n=1 Tax=Acrasis kona TaxID=1008807 RepID=A0AAW2YTU3_9EUKA
MPQGTHHPELKRYMEKRLTVKLSGNRRVTGVLRGYDQFMNLTIENAVEDETKESLGMVVIRGNSIEMMECLDPLPMKKN